MDKGKLALKTILILAALSIMGFGIWHLLSVTEFSSADYTLALAITAVIMGAVRD